MNEKKLDSYKKRLIEDKERLESELHLLGSKDDRKLDVTYPESGSNSDEDNAAEITEFVDIVSVEARLQGDLEDVNKALKSIEKGTYGICKYCGKKIADKRLNARPSSSSCVACKKVLTQEM